MEIPYVNKSMKTTYVKIYLFTYFKPNQQTSNKSPSEKLSWNKESRMF